jgi:ABC-2 type transport system ATP-binding protein
VDDAQPAVVCDGLVIRYGDKVAVDGFSFEARSGEILALLGPNGAGKTSTVEALEGYRTISGGTVRVLGLDPVRDHDRLVPDIGVMLQKGGIYPMLGPAQLLTLFSRYYDDPEDPDALLGLVGLDEVRRTPWRRLSGGEQQRLSLALALVGRPRVLFLDEPTAGVDPEGRLIVRQLIAEQKRRGLCVILTTHELTEAERLADRVAIIDHGRMLAEGSPAELAAGTTDGSIRFTTAPGIDTGALGSAVSVTVTEEHPGSYRLVPPPGSSPPAVIAALTGWLAASDLSLGDLRTGQSLEEAYLAITGSRGTGGPGGGGDGDGDGSEDADADESGGGRRRGRRGRSGRTGGRRRSGRALR